MRDVLRLVLGLAVKSGALKVNPVTDVEVARTARAEMIFLEPDQIMALAAEVTAPPVRYRREERRRDGYPEYGLLVRFAAFTGLRAGELVALRAADLDVMRRRVDVKASASEAYGELQLVVTKTYERRTVPIPRSLIDELASRSPAAVLPTSCGRARTADHSGTRTGSSGISSRRCCEPACRRARASTT